jgi:DNA-binding NarL/FixJ family response regulator
MSFQGLAARSAMFVDLRALERAVVRLPARLRVDDRLGALSAREREVLALMAEGRSNGAIADELVVSAGAVEKHVANIFTKLGLLPSPDAHRRVLAVLAFLEVGSRSDG